MEGGSVWLHWRWSWRPLSAAMDSDERVKVPPWWNLHVAARNVWPLKAAQDQLEIRRAFRRWLVVSQLFHLWGVNVMTESLRWWWYKFISAKNLIFFCLYIFYHQQPFTFRLGGFYTTGPSTQDDTGVTSHSLVVSRDHLQQTQAHTIYIHLKPNKNINHER